MRHKFFAIPALAPNSGEEALNTFCTQHQVSFVKRELVSAGVDSFWSVCVVWQSGETSLPATPRQRKPQTDYKKLLGDDDFSLYLELREIRKEITDREGIPPYAVFINDHLAAMLQERVSTKAGMEKISGIGKKRIDKYSDVFLEKLNEIWARDTAGSRIETG